MKEEWRLLQLHGKTYCNYSVSSKGAIMNNSSCHILTSKKNSSGYVHTMLCLNGKKTLCSNHRVVAETYLPNFEGYKYVKFIDGDKSNISAENLYWSPETDKRGNYKSAVTVVDSNGTLFPSITEAAKAHHLSASVVSRHLRRGTSTRSGVSFSEWSK